ncbi:fungal-specific transcription factor domain-containing protein [Biscogniauxia sp. FL1348]|nr:fungal-specific transcription factor domain-containing protein [Biscogniauxia sp. FL1348]
MADAKPAPLTSAHDGNYSPSSGTPGAPPRSIKRPRPVKSCLEPHHVAWALKHAPVAELAPPPTKLKCDRLLSCSQCQRSQRTCRYAAEGEAVSLSDGSDVETPEKAPKRPCHPPPLAPSHASSRSSVSYANSSVLDDHATRIERLEKLLLARSPSIPETTPSVRHQRPAASPQTIRGLTVKGGLRTRFFGQSSTRVLLNLFDEAKDIMLSGDGSDEIREKFLNIQRINKALQDEHRKATAPITVFVDSMTPIQKRMADVLPSKPVCDHLVQMYLGGTENLYRVLHIPTFKSQYRLYWEGNPQHESFLPQLLSILCIGYRFLGLGKGQYHDRDGIHIPTACALVRAWLDSLRGKQLVEFSTLQAEILRLMAQRMLDAQNQESWTHLGLIVRMAMTMGMHRDPSEFAPKIPPFWAEVRRRVWYTILELDVHMSMQCNLPSCIREGDFTCQPPRNLNDEDLRPDMEEAPASRPLENDTDNRIQAFAARSLPYRFQIVDLINRIDNLQDYQQVLDLGNALERVFEDVRYLLPAAHSPEAAMDPRRLWQTRVILDMNCRRPLLALYRPFALSSPDAPQQIMTGYLRSSMVLLSYLDDVDPSSPEYQSTWNMHHLVLKQDILQAAFGVCYYIKQTSRGLSTPSPSSPLLASRVSMSRDSTSSGYNNSISNTNRNTSIEEACAIATASSPLLTPQRLKATVEKVLDSMLKRIREVGTDIKDIVSLMTVFYTYREGSLEQRREAIKRGMQSIVDAGLQSIHAKQENIASMPITPSLVNMPMNNNFQTNTALMNQMQPFLLNADIPPNAITDDFSVWDMEFWDPLLQTGPT